MSLKKETEYHPSEGRKEALSCVCMAQLEVKKIRMITFECNKQKASRFLNVPSLSKHFYGSLARQICERNPSD